VTYLLAVVTAKNLEEMDFVQYDTLLRFPERRVGDLPKDTQLLYWKARVQWHIAFREGELREIGNTLLQRSLWRLNVLPENVLTKSTGVLESLVHVDVDPPESQDKPLPSAPSPDETAPAPNLAAGVDPLATNIEVPSEWATAQSSASARPLPSVPTTSCLPATSGLWKSPPPKVKPTPKPRGLAAENLEYISMDDSMNLNATENRSDVAESGDRDPLHHLGTGAGKGPSSLLVTCQRCHSEWHATQDCDVSLPEQPCARCGGTDHWYKNWWKCPKSPGAVGDQRHKRKPSKPGRCATGSKPKVIWSTLLRNQGN